MSSHTARTLVAQCALALDGWRASYGADELDGIREMLANTAAEDAIREEARNDLDAICTLLDGVACLFRQRQSYPADLEEAVFRLKLMVDMVELSLPEDPTVIPFRPRAACPQPSTQPPGSAA